MKPSIIPNTQVPGVNISFTTNLADQNLSSSIPKVLFLGQRNAARIEPARFQGGTLNDCTSQGTYTGTVKTNYLVVIDGTGTPDTFKWSKDGGATWEATTVSITGAAQALDSGVTITFGATTGHAAADSWEFSAHRNPTIAAQTPTEFYSVDDIREKCGQGSMLHVMASAALRQAQAYRMFFCSLADNGSNKATGSATVTGTATSAGSWVLTIGSKRAEIAIAVGDTPADISIAMQNKFIETINDLPVTINENTATPGKLDIIAINAGTIGNQIEMVSEITDADGVSVALVQLTSGSTDPDSDNALTAVFNSGYERYIFPWNIAAEITKLITHLDDISEYDEQRPATAYIGVVDSNANVQTLATGANSGRVVLVSERGTRDIPYELGAKFAASLAVRAGADPTAGMNGIEMIGVNEPTLDTNRYTVNEMNTLLEAGVTPLKVQADGKVVVVREVTTFLTVGGSPSTELHEGNTIRILDYARNDIKTQLERIFNGVDNTIAIRNAIVETIADRMRLMEDADILKNVETDIPNITIQTNPSNVNRVDLVIPITAISLLHNITAEMVLYLN